MLKDHASTKHPTSTIRVAIAVVERRDVQKWSSQFESIIQTHDVIGRVDVV
jgi:hypothetical protein